MTARRVHWRSRVADGPSQSEWLAKARAQAEALRDENLNDEPDAWDYSDYFEGDVEVYKNDPA